MTHSISRRLLLAAAAATTLALAACGQQQSTPAATAPATPAAPAAAPAQVVVATNAAFAPFEYVAPSGQIEGFDMDVIRAVGERGGFEVKFVNTPWEGIFSTLNSGEASLIASGVTITDERRKSMDFADPYFDAVQLIAVLPSSTITSLEGIKGVKVGVLNGSTGDEVVSKLLGKTHADIKRFEALPVALKELEAGGVAAVVGDNGVVRHYMTNNNSSFKLMEDNSFTPEQYGFAIKKGNTELLQKVNDGLKAIRADGSYDKIYAKWFGTATVTTAPATPVTDAPAADPQQPAAASSAPAPEPQPEVVPAASPAASQ